MYGLGTPIGDDRASTIPYLLALCKEGRFCCPTISTLSLYSHRKMTLDTVVMIRPLICFIAVGTLVLIITLIIWRPAPRAHADHFTPGNHEQHHDQAHDCHATICQAADSIPALSWLTLTDKINTKLP